MMLSAPAGNDLQFDEALCLQGRNFANKVWNAHRLISGWETDDKIPVDKASEISNKWFESKLNRTIKELDEQYKSFRISESLRDLDERIFQYRKNYYNNTWKKSFPQRGVTWIYSKQDRGRD